MLDLLWLDIFKDLYFPKQQIKTDVNAGSKTKNEYYVDLKPGEFQFQHQINEGFLNFTLEKDKDFFW